MPQRPADPRSDLFTVAFHDSPIGMVVTDRDGVVLRANAAFTTLVDRSPDEIVGSHYLDVAHPDDIAHCRGVLGKLVAGGIDSTSTMLRIQRSDGSRVAVTARASNVRDHDGDPRYVIQQFVPAPVPDLASA